MPPAGRAISAGERIAFTVRPEKLTIAAESDPVAENLCTVAGTVVDVVYQGVSTQLVVRSDDGVTLVAFHQNRERVSDAGVPGDRAPGSCGIPYSMSCSVTSPPSTRS